jgi:acetate---CoA ligase (ADP-forming)
MPDLRALFWPRSVAIVGAASDSTRLRGRLTEIVSQHAFDGALYPVSRSETEIMGMKAYPSIAEVPAPVDLAAIIVPAKFVPSVLEDCGKAGVKAAAIFTSGFTEERGETGALLQRQLAEIARRYDMAVSGPNSEGFANTRANLCPTFSPAVEPDGEPLFVAGSRARPLAVVAQSGGIGFSFFDRSRAKALPFAYVVTTGNEACLETLDVVEFLLDEGEVGAVLIFLEDVKTPARLAPVAGKALRAGVPLLLTKIGRSEAGARAAASHTASLAGSYQGYRAMFRRHGLIEGDDTEQLVDLAAGFAFCHDRLPRGPRVAVLTPSGGGGGWMADALAAAGLEVPTLGAATRAAIDKHLPSYGTSANPVDVTAQAIRAVGYARLLEMIVADDGIDAVVVVMSGRSTAVLSEDRENLLRLAARLDKPVLFWSYTVPARRNVEILAEAGIPLFTNMVNCARCLGAMVEYRAFRAAELAAPAVRHRSHRARGAVARALGQAGPVLSEYAAGELLARYGFPIGERRLARSAAQAVAAARAFGGRVALKLQSPAFPHKSEAGLVALDLASAITVRSAYATLTARATAADPAAEIEGVMVAPMAPAGVEMLLGVHRDATFGPMLSAGLGGIFVEVMRDVAMLPLPIDRRLALGMLQGLAGWPLLDGVRGAAPADVGALVDLMLRLSRFALDHAGTIAEIDLNPVRVHAEGQGLSILDALIVRG